MVSMSQDEEAASYNMTVGCRLLPIFVDDNEALLLSPASPAHTRQPPHITMVTTQASMGLCTCVTTCVK